MKTLSRLPQRHRRPPRGQAMVEYSILNWVLILALVLSMTTIKFDGNGAKGMNVIDAFLRAYQIYYDSYYFVLNLPFP